MRRRLEELKTEAALAALVGDLDELAAQLQEARPKRTGPVGASTALHLLVLLALIIQSWRSASLAPRRADINIVFEPPSSLHEPSVTAPIRPPRAAEKDRPKTPREELAQPRREARKPLAPPPVPKEVPPPVPLPPPKRMGEQVPIPHFPVPGAVPPEQGKVGKPGPPAPQEKSAETKGPPGAPEGADEKDAGAGEPGIGGASAGIVPGGTKGSISVARLGGGIRNLEGSGGGGRRKGLNLSLPVESGAFGDFSFDDMDYDWSDYWSQMYWAIWRAWMNRLYVTLPAFDRWSFQNRAASLRGSVLIRFVIERNGSVSSIVVLESSTMLPLDESAQSALKEVILPRLPEDFTKQKEGVTGRFSMEIDDQAGWKEYMRYQKYRGIF